MKNPKYLFQVYEKPPRVPPPGALFGSASICVCVCHTFPQEDFQGLHLQRRLTFNKD